MVKIRLRRTGAKKRPSYRFVVTDSRAPRDGAFIEILGYYDPLTEPATVVVKADRARLWLSRGAQPTETVAKLLSRVDLSEQPAAEVPSASETESAAEA